MLNPAFRALFGASGYGLASSMLFLLIDREEGYTVKELTAAFNITPATARTTISRLRRIIAVRGFSITSGVTNETYQLLYPSDPNMLNPQFPPYYPSRLSHHPARQDQGDSQ